MSRAPCSASRLRRIFRREIALGRFSQLLHHFGLYISAAAHADRKDYAEGRIDIDEFVARGRARYGLR